MMNIFKTEQEGFWAGQFGDSYADRNQSKALVASNIKMFSNIIAGLESLQSVLELGANIGMNLLALRQLLPEAELSAIEINEKAVEKLKQISAVKVYHQSILDFEPDYQRELVFSKGVLIHINPEYLGDVYEVLYNSASRYICIAEYYNPTPVEINYRGFENRLFKRDFAGEMLDKYKDLRLVNYGFCYHRDPLFPQDDISWFLLNKK